MPPSGDVDDAFKHLGAYSQSVATFFSRRCVCSHSIAIAGTP